MQFLKKFQFWIPTIYSLILIVDLEEGFNLTGGQFLVWLASPAAWINFFQKASTKVIAIILSFIIWYLLGKLIDILIERQKQR